MRGASTGKLSQPKQNEQNRKSHQHKDQNLAASLCSAPHTIAVTVCTHALLRAMLPSCWRASR